MDPGKFGAVALRGREINNPLRVDSLDRIISRCDPPPGARVVDVGCGKGAFLFRLAERRTVLGEGIDISEGAIRYASRHVAPGPKRGSLLFRCADARTQPTPQPAYHLAVCLGATHAFGGLAPTLRALGGWTVPDGWIVVGEGFWRQPPAPEYLEVLGAPADELTDDLGNVRIGETLGLTLVDHWTSSAEEWDEFERDYLDGIESYARETPEDPDVPEMLRRIRRWRRAYLRWGKETLGFGVYVFRNGSQGDSPRPGAGGADPT
ncbi:MAG: class I SAM-dependent methyltransferase, partial [Thermoplasmata archaeon]|nr:class I SAM-dependent methyltransferase [Thermoplasmata archaeon]